MKLLKIGKYHKSNPHTTLLYHAYAVILCMFRNTAVNMSNSMAFISQFGEYNPGGGKEEVLKYLNEAEKQVVLAEKALRKIIECLEIK